LTRFISVLAVFIAILFAIVAYNYYIIDETKLSDSFDTLGDRIETTNVGMIYPTKIGGDEWFMDPTKLKEDKRFDANANLTRNKDGTWSVDSKEQTRLNIWTNDSGDFRRKGGMDTYNHSSIEARGFWYKPSDWKNTEITRHFCRFFHCFFGNSIPCISLYIQDTDTVLDYRSYFIYCINNRWDRCYVHW
jgi:hypothetical protein